jgi:hypothetical protein
MILLLQSNRSTGSLLPKFYISVTSGSMGRSSQHPAVFESGATVSKQVQAVTDNLYARLGTIMDSVVRTTQLDKQVEHAVDREGYVRRDREMQRALERMATKDELRDVNDTLRSIQESISPRRR